MQFYDLIPLGEISVALGMSYAQGLENRKYACAFWLSHSLTPVPNLPCSHSLTVCVQLQHLHKNICLYTQILVRGSNS